MNKMISNNRIKSAIVWICTILTLLPWGGVGGGLLLTSCTEVDPYGEEVANKFQLSITPSSVTLDDMGRAKVQISAPDNMSWYCYNQWDFDDYMRISNSEGTGSREISVEADESDSKTDQRTTIQLYSHRYNRAASFDVIIPGTYVRCAPASATFPADGSPISLAVKSNAIWSIYDYPSWVKKVSLPSVIVRGENNIQLTAAANTSLVPKEGELVFKTKAGLFSFNLSQDKGEASEFVYFVGTTNGWGYPEQKLALQEDGIYTGFIYIAALSGRLEFKFQKRPGDTADDSQLTCYNIPNVTGDFGKTSLENFKALDGSGVYYVALNLMNNSLSGEKVNTMSIIGEVTDWSDDLVMTWNATDYCFEHTGKYVEGEWKFRIDKDWSFNLGGDTKDNLVLNGENLTDEGNVVKLYPTRKTSNHIFATVGFVDPTVSLNYETIDYKANGVLKGYTYTKELTVKVDTYSRWFSTSVQYDNPNDTDWIHVSNDAQNNTFKVSVSANKSKKKRSGTIVVSTEGKNKAHVSVTQEAAATIEFDRSVLTFGANQTSAQYVKVTTNAASWSCKQNDNWITATKDGSSIKVTVSKWNGTIQREGSVTVTTDDGTDESFKVIQKEATVITFSPTSITFPANGKDAANGNDYKDVTVNTNAISWTYKPNNSWIRVSRFNSTIRVYVDKWNGTSRRTGSVTVTADNDGTQESFNVYQDPPSSITFSPTGLSFSATDNINNPQYVTVTTSATSWECASSDNTWLKAEMINSTHIKVYVSEWTGSSQRKGTVTVTANDGGQNSFNVTQDPKNSNSFELGDFESDKKLD